MDSGKKNTALLVTRNVKIRRKKKKTYSEGGGVRVEDVDPELLQCFLKDDIYHRVLFTVF